MWRPQADLPHIDGVKGHHPSAAQSRSGQFHDLHQRSAQPVPQMCEELADMLVTCPPPAQRAFFLGERTGRRCLTGITTASSGPDCVTGITTTRIGGGLLQPYKGLIPASA